MVCKTSGFKTSSASKTMELKRISGGKFSHSQSVLSRVLDSSETQSLTELFSLENRIIPAPQATVMAKQPMIA